MTQDNYDPTTYSHWLHWELKRLKGSPDDFQRMFEDVATRSQDRFVRVRAYGQIGDRKCDGLFWGDGVIYQVYSPDVMTSAATQEKIEADLSGAVKHWGSNLKKWVFVYNVRRGLPPDVVGLLQKQQAQYQGLIIEPMSNDDLWQIARTLPAQDRAEILGPPLGFEGLFTLNLGVPARTDDGRFVFIQDALAPIDILRVVEALRPAVPFGPPVFLTPSVQDDAWQSAAQYQALTVETAIERSREQLPRFAVFSLAPISLAIHLGFTLSDRVAVDLFQFDRDRKSWTWDPVRPADPIRVEGLPDQNLLGPTEVSIRISLSAHVHASEVNEAVGALPVNVHLSVETPDVAWLVSPHQLAGFAKTFRDTLATLRAKIPALSRVHLFYAGPTAGAVALGQSINPNMNPPIQLYEYDRRRSPHYRPTIVLS